MSDELGRMWKEEVVVQCNVLSLYLPERTVENYEEPQSGKPVYEPRFESGTSRMQSRSVNNSTTTFGLLFGEG
jgi:hypothetical protein